VVDVAALVRTFGTRRALDGVSFALQRGECLSLFGPNGAGKTTLLRVLAGLLRPTRGSAHLGGVALPGGAVLRSRVGMISHQSMLYGALTSLENVEFAATMFGVTNARAAAIAALERLGVADRAATRVALLSRGLQQRVSIARAIVHAPRLLLADEPYSGLDAAGAGALTRVLRDLRADGAAMVIVTHNVGEGLALATQAAVLAGGRVVRHDASAQFNVTTYAAEYQRLVGGDAA
jgi:heme exporter protein A